MKGHKKDQLTPEMASRIWKLATKANNKPPRLGNQYAQSDAFNELRPLLAQLVKNGETK